MLNLKKEPLINGTKDDSSAQDDIEYPHKGIAERNFPVLNLLSTWRLKVQN